MHAADVPLLSLVVGMHAADVPLLSLVVSMYAAAVLLLSRVVRMLQQMFRCCRVFWVCCSRCSAVVACGEYAAADVLLLSRVVSIHAADVPLLCCRPDRSRL